ncbi:MAG: hypothetical protein ACK5PD_02150, partial [Pirellulaceae bacterium]
KGPGLMTLLGKVFTGLIFVLSVAFFSLALAVNATHTKWKDAVLNPSTGFNVQISRLQAGNKELQTSLLTAKNEIAQEQAARRVTLAALQTQLDALKDQLSQKTAELQDMQASVTQMTQTLNATQTELQRVTTENTAVKQQLDQVMNDRNDLKAKVIALTDDVNNKKVLLATLENKISDLTSSLTLSEARLMNAQGALARAGIQENPDDVPPADVKGVVLAVGQNGLVEISLGRDDGIREGHQLDVYRGGQYLGRIEIRRTQDDKSVGQILPGFRKGFIQQGDDVAATVG